MKKIITSSILSLMILTSCSSNSKLPDDSIFVQKGNLVQNLNTIFQTGNFYNFKGSIIKENNKYYFVDSNSIYHCSVFEDTRIYKNNDYSKYTSQFEGIEENKECYIWVSYNISYDGIHKDHTDDRLMCLDVGKFEKTKDEDRTNYQLYGFYDHVLDIYYDCSTDKISEHDLQVTYEKYPELKKI